MLSFIAATSMTAILAGALEPAGQRPADLPTVTISVHTAPAISPVIIDRTLEEASAIWRPTGVTFKWQKAASVHAEANPPRPTRPRVLIDDKRGTREYRIKVAGVLARRAAQIARKRAGGK